MSDLRLSPWRPKPSLESSESIRLALASSFYLVQQPGPTSFVVVSLQEGSSSSSSSQANDNNSSTLAPDPLSQKHRVLIGARQTCSCGGGMCMDKNKTGALKSKNNTGVHRLPPSVGDRIREPELCVHILFVMLKVLRVPPRNPLVWQLSLTDRELDEVLRCGAKCGQLSQRQKAAQAAQRRIERKKKLAQDAERAHEMNARRNVEPDETCPICYETIDDWSENDEARAMLVWCRDGCGRNVHGKCMRYWSEHQASLEKSLTCPLCRAPWGPFDWEPPREMWRRSMRTNGANVAAAASTGSVHYGAACNGCRRGGATDGAPGGDAGFAPVSGGGAAASCAIIGRRFDCAICASISLCEACFQRGCHPQHPFTVRIHPTDVPMPAERELAAPNPHEDVADALAATAAAAATAAEAASEAARRVARERRRAKEKPMPPTPPVDPRFGLLNLEGLRIGSAAATTISASSTAHGTPGARRPPAKPSRRGGLTSTSRRADEFGLAVAGTSVGSHV